MSSRKNVSSTGYISSSLQCFGSNHGEKIGLGSQIHYPLNDRKKGCILDIGNIRTAILLPFTKGFVYFGTSYTFLDII